MTLHILGVCVFYESRTNIFSLRISYILVDGLDVGCFYELRPRSDITVNGDLYGFILRNPSQNIVFS